MLSDLLFRLRSLFRRKTVEGELDDELRFHFERQVEKYTQSGLTREEAMRRARLEFGGADQVKEECRDARGVHFIETLAQDIRHGFRTLHKSPGFTTVAVLMLAIGIGSNTAIFSMVHGILLSALPYPQPQQLYAIHEVVPQLSSLAPILPVNSGNFLLWKQRCPAFSGMAALSAASYTLIGEGEPRHVDVALVSSDFFSLMGVRPQLGQLFSPEALHGQANEVILTHQIWETVFHSDSQILGKAVSLDGSSFTVAGVLPLDFRFPEFFGHPQLFLSLVFSGNALHAGVGNFNYGVVARLKPGTTATQALAQLNVVEVQIAHEGVTWNKAAPAQFDLFAKLTPLRDEIVGSTQSALWILMAAAAFVLLIICVNLANLMLVRNAGRSHEVAVRSALGASPRQLAQQFLTEAFLLSAAGGMLGLFFASLGLKLLIRNIPLGIPRVENVGIEPAVLWFTLALSIFAMLLFAVLPALRVVRVAPLQALRSSGRTATKGKKTTRLYDGLVISEIALCCVLLAGALLLVQSLLHVVNANRWMAEQHVLAINLTLPYQYKDDAQRYQFYSKVSEKVQTLPGVKSIGWVSKLPLLGTAWGDDIQFQEMQQSGIKASIGEFRFVSPGYLNAIGIPLIRGRWFSAKDQGQDVTVISESVAKNFLRGRDPIGMHLVWQEKPRRVIGVVADVRALADDKLISAAYIPLWSLNEPTETLVVRTSMDARAAGGAIRSAIWSVDSQIAIPPEQSLQTIVQQSIAPRQYETFLSALFASFAVILAALGLYGVISYSVSQRTHEIGLRIALGAQPRDVLRLVLGHGGRMALFGIGIGTAAALILTRLMASLLFGVSATDPLTLVGVDALLMLIALAACYIPARRAMRVDPMVVLRYE